MRQSLEVLRLSAQELEAVLDREAAENPFIRRPAAGGETHHGFPDLVPAPEPGLMERLFRQLRMQDLAPGVLEAAVHIVGELREDGYLDTPLEDVAEALGQEIGTVKAGLAAIQSCEPAGIAARSLAECLELQLVDAGLERPLAGRVVAMLEGFRSSSHSKLATALGLTRDEVRDIAALIPTLRARPVEPDAAITPIILPDLVVTRSTVGGLTVSLARGPATEIEVDDGALGSARSAEIDTLRIRAHALVRALRQRGQTLLRIGRFLIDEQASFFLLGPAGLVPLTRAAAAERMGMHPSTLGRAIASKALLFDGRHIPLSAFFGPAFAVDGGTISSQAVQHRIRALVEGEDRAAPLADAEIVAHLRMEGVDISRRTVAKYRQWMRIPSSFARRRLRPGKPQRP